MISLTRRGAQIILARITALNDLERIVRKVHHRLTGSGEVLRLVLPAGFRSSCPKMAPRSDCRSIPSWTAPA